MKAERSGKERAGKCEGCGCCGVAEGGEAHEEEEAEGARWPVVVASVLFFGLLAAGWCGVLPEGRSRAAAFVVPWALAGAGVARAAWKHLRRGVWLDENVLMLMASAGAFALGEAAEAAAVMVLYQVGEGLQDAAVGRSRRSIAALMDIRPDQATVLRGSEEVVVGVAEVGVGEWVVVRPGEKVPLDGIIVRGATAFDTSALTGESLPRDAGVGDEVLAGFVNQSGLVEVQVTAGFGESTASRILELVEHAEARKARTEKFITRFARVYTPVVVGAAVAVAVVPPLAGMAFGGGAAAWGGWSEWMRRALVFLVASCPCALVLSIPVAFFAGVGGASRKGVLVKGAAALEQLARTGTVVFDKTGTLTKGVFSVVAVHPQVVSADELLDLAAVAESHSTHPVAASIVRAHGGHIDEGRIGEVREEAGMGVRAIVDGHEIAIGNGRLMAAAGAEWHDCHQAGTAIHVARDGVYMGHVVVADVVKDDAAEAVRALRRMGVGRIVMLTGDAGKNGEAVGRELGIDEVRAELLPAQKAGELEALARQGREGTLAFVGDGINDAPALARADVGIAMGAMGSDAAMEAADVVLMDDQPSKVAAAVVLARKVMRLAKENVWLALGIKAVVMAAAVAGYPSLWLAVFADSGVALLCVANSLRALR